MAVTIFGILAPSNFRAKKSTKKCNWAKKALAKYHFLVTKKDKYLKTLGLYFGIPIALYRGMNTNKKENFKASIQIIIIWFGFFAMSFIF